MKKPGKIVLKDTGYIAFFVLILSLLMEAIFLVFNAWTWKVICANILSGGFAVLNFLIMGMSVEKAVEKDEKDAKAVMKASQSLRQLMLLVVAGVGAYFFNWIAAVVPLFFPRIAITVRSLSGKNN